MFFKKKEKAETAPSGDEKNPYLNARQEWLERYGSYISRAAQWRLTTIIALVLLAGSITGNVIQACQVKAIPYIVEVDKLGKSAVVARADQASAWISLANRLLSRVQIRPAQRHYA